MSLEKDISQQNFRNENHKTVVNIIYTYHWITEKIRGQLDAEDLTMQQFNILRILRGSDPEPLSTLQIRDRMLDKMSDTSRIVDRLLAKGLASKKPSKTDKRLVEVKITAKGKAILAKLDKKNKVMDDLMSELNESEMKTLSKLLDKLRNSAGMLLMMLMLLVSFSLSAQEKKYEFRAAWVATVDNIDWPSKKGLPVDSQKAEFVRLADMHKMNGMNALIVQIRPATDAFYPSPYEPWSEWLTGTQGQPPMPYYDPLQFMIEETHKRGMEFHAWCNPYRADYLIGKTSISPSHITKVRPEWFLEYGGKRYFDPGNKAVQEYTIQVIKDVLERYDVDGLHFDDYFYPYRIAGKEFPDGISYSTSGTTLARDDWRRSNVDSIIVRLHRLIRAEKPGCKFGISPFGVWRNSDKDPMGSNTKAGQTNYDDLYANILLWLKEGWIDYVAPQLYWEFGHRAAPYEVLLEWWSKNTYGRHCYIGLGIYRAGSNAAWRDTTLLARQIDALRNTPNIQGAIYFSSKSFINNPNGWSEMLRTKYYAEPAETPIMPWLSK